VARNELVPAQSRSLDARPAPRGPGPLASRRRFLRFFPGGFHDPTYLDWERDYKWDAHLSWIRLLNSEEFRGLLDERAYSEIAMRAVRIESRTNLLFSFEKMAIRDAVRDKVGARAFATGLYDFVYGEERDEQKFERWCAVIASLPRRQTRVLTWPVATVFGFIALPRRHVFLKPNVTRIAARQYGYDFAYTPRPSWPTYASLLRFARIIRRDLRDLRPRDMIDIQSFIWVLGSDEY